VFLNDLQVKRNLFSVEGQMVSYMISCFRTFPYRRKFSCNSHFCCPAASIPRSWLRWYCMLLYKLKKT